MFNTAIQFSNNSCNVIKIQRKISADDITSSTIIPQMAAKNKDTKKLYDDTALRQAKKGMDAFPMGIYNDMISHALSHGELRNAMFFICMANWGMRYSDVVRVRFCHIFDESGKFKEVFTLPNGEQKTGKQNVYYNNKATMKIISFYLSQPENRLKTPFDYLFVSESGYAKATTAGKIEAEERYGYKIKLLEKQIADVDKKRDSLLNLFADNAISKTDFIELNQNLQAEKCSLNEQLIELNNKKKDFISSTDYNDIRVQAGLTRQAAEDIIKNTLLKINVIPLNHKNKCQVKSNLNLKINTHSLRKTFSEQFVITGLRLNDEGLLGSDSVVLSLLQHKFMHSNMDTTNRYNKTEENDFKLICQNMNIGLEIVEKYSMK